MPFLSHTRTPLLYYINNIRVPVFHRVRHIGVMGQIDGKKQARIGTRTRGFSVKNIERTPIFAKVGTNKLEKITKSRLLPSAF